MPQPPRTRAEFDALLAEALAATKNLSALFTLHAPIKGGQTADLRGLTLEEKMALGKQVCDQLGDLIFRVNPIANLDRLEERLGRDKESARLADLALKKLAAGGLK